jgi:hypothetical protein
LLQLDCDPRSGKNVCLALNCDCMLPSVTEKPKSAPQHSSNLRFVSRQPDHYTPWIPSLKTPAFLEQKTCHANLNRHRRRAKAIATVQPFSLLDKSRANSEIIESSPTESSTHRRVNERQQTPQNLWVRGGVGRQSMGGVYIALGLRVSELV